MIRRLITCRTTAYGEEISYLWEVGWKDAQEEESPSVSRLETEVPQPLLLQEVADA